MIIEDNNIDILLESFFECYELHKKSEKDIFKSTYEEWEYVLLDNTLTNYFYILDILGFDIDIKETDNTCNIIVSLDGKEIKTI